MGQPLTQWQCDVCRRPVDIKDGYVVWSRYGKPHFEYRIIHKKRCDTDGKKFLSSLPLADLMGPDGLVKLTSWLSFGLADVAQEKQTRESGAADYPLPPLDPWVDLVRRLHVPHYEETRRLFLLPEVWDDISDCTESYPYLQDSMATFRERYAPIDDAVNDDET